MDENKLRFGVGVLVIAAIGIGIILTFLFGAFPSVLSREYTLLVEFPSASGVSTNTPVLRDGVKIGRVVDIRLLPEKGVLLELAMMEQYPLSHEYVPRIGVGSVITGDATVDFTRADSQHLASIFQNETDRALIPTTFTDSEYLFYGEKRSDPFDMLYGMEQQVRDTMDSIRIAGNSINTAGQDVSQLVTEARQVVGGTDSKIDKVADEAVKALEEFQGAMREVRTFIGNPEMKGSLEKSLARLPDVLKEAQGALESTQRTFNRFERVGTQFEKVGVAAESTVKDARSVVDNVNRTVDTVRSTVEDAGGTLDTIEGTFSSAERTIKNVERFSVPLAQNGDQIVAQVLQSLRSVDRALAQVESFGASLNNNDGTVKRLLEDDEIYWQIRRTIENVEQASSKIRPILDDVRIFSDKLARDPREIGVRGALSRRPSGLGVK